MVGAVKRFLNRHLQSHSRMHKMAGTWKILHWMQLSHRNSHQKLLQLWTKCRHLPQGHPQQEQSPFKAVSSTMLLHPLRQTFRPLRLLILKAVAGDRMWPSRQAPMQPLGLTDQRPSPLQVQHFQMMLLAFAWAVESPACVPASKPRTQMAPLFSCMLKHSTLLCTVGARFASVQFGDYTCAG
jgi:hypothetical protein